ncbi:MAG: hypothetical protein GC181_04390 [Bacteroidetes bacterium]|nr:hypothetical protein [Bacteroidota bacterium]
MRPEEIGERSHTLSNACVKVAAVMQATTPILVFCRAELIRHASDLAIQSKGLAGGQLSGIFVERLNRAADACFGCSYWLELIVREKILDATIIKPLIQESEQMSAFFMAAMRSAKSKME